MKNKMEELHKSVNFENFTYHYKGENTDVNFNNFIDAKTLLQ